MSKPQNLPNRTNLENHFIYYNLHKGCWSLKAGDTYNPGKYDKVFTTATVKGRVTGHADTVLVSGLTTKISESGRLRVIREKRKNVHAGIIAASCTVGPIYKYVTTDTTPTLSYNPYKAGYFYDRATGAIVTTARYAVMMSGCDGRPPRVFYGDDLFYAYWSDGAGGIDFANTVGFLNQSDLYRYIGQPDFTGRVRRVSEPYSTYLTVHNGCISYAA